jgi:hypothetical protein
MPRKTELSKDNARKAREYLKTNGVGFEVAYHVLRLANEADGRPSTGIDPNAPSTDELNPSDVMALNTAKSALGL